MAPARFVGFETKYLFDPGFPFGSLPTTSLGLFRDFLPAPQICKSLFESVPRFFSGQCQVRRDLRLPTRFWRPAPGLAAAFLIKSTRGPRALAIGNSGSRRGDALQWRQVREQILFGIKFHVPDSANPYFFEFSAASFFQPGESGFKAYRLFAKNNCLFPALSHPNLEWSRPSRHGLGCRHGRSKLPISRP